MTVTMGKEAGLKLSLAKHGSSIASKKMQGIHKISTGYMYNDFQVIMGYKHTVRPYLKKMM